MKRTSRSPVESQADDALDRLLREYFQTQLPRSFPPLPLPEANAAPRARRTRSPLSRSRWIVAVCVALVLLAFGWLLKTESNSATTSLPPITSNDNTATGGNPMPSPMPPQSP